MPNVVFNFILATEEASVTKICPVLYGEVKVQGLHLVPKPKNEVGSGQGKNRKKGTLLKAIF